jgi:hypothetical protein
MLAAVRKNHQRTGIRRQQDDVLAAGTSAIAVRAAVVTPAWLINHFVE